jgi:hypothetical protein
MKIRREDQPGKMYGVVRDRNGKIKLDCDPADLHPGIVMLMTAKERAEFGLWDGPLVRDANGVKRIKKNTKTFTAKDALVAASEIWFDGGRYRIAQRIDVPAGGTFTVEEEA